MTNVDAAKHEDKVVTRQCNICGFKFSFECYPRTGANQHTARRETAVLLAEHLPTHSINEIISYLKRIHQV